MTEELRVVALADDCVNDDDDDSVVGDDVDNDALELVDESMANEELDDCTDEDEVGGCWQSWMCSALKPPTSWSMIDLPVGAGTSSPPTPQGRGAQQAMPETKRPS
ncbi:uncharacterized protein PG998_012873 [Apiospora kogelbergensis]|uniref:Uncharacterized protein n=1 Tax=Apiospora kogelbergensis TaxID=1337665 RepID=A0AAW0Q3D7_9PEZI